MPGQFLPANYQATITAEATKGGDYWVAADGSEYTAISAGSSGTLGPFDTPKVYEVRNLTWEVSQHIVGDVDDLEVDVDLKNYIANPVVDYGTNGAIAEKYGVIRITKAGVCALTLAAPVAADAGKILYIVSDTANAHTVTATDLIQDGVTGGAKDLATFEAFAGASLTLMALNLKWHVISKNAVTITGS